MPFDFGPEPLQVRGYGRNMRGLPSTAQAFYDATRAQRSPYGYAALCVLLPFLPFAVALAFVQYFQSGAAFNVEMNIDAQAKVARQILSGFCDSPLSDAAERDASLGAIAHFSAAHVAFLGASVLALAGGMTLTFNVLRIHLGARLDTFLALAGPAALAAFVVSCGFYLFADVVKLAFDSLRFFPAGLVERDFACLTPYASAADRVGRMATAGVAVVVVAVAALITAAAVTAWRFELTDIDGVWADTYVLRHKLRSLLTLFTVGSILLVSTNIALASLCNVSASMLEEVALAAKAGGTKDDASPQPAPICPLYTLSCSAPAVAKQPPAGNPPIAVEAITETLAQVKNLRNEILAASGILGTLLLAAIFAPALYALLGEIETAGKTHAAKGKDGLGPAYYPVAGVKSVQDWKEEHGLAVSVSQIASSIVAVLAPVLSGGVLDVGKAIIGS